MVKSILTFRDLRELTGLKSPAAVERQLIKQGVRVLHGAAGPWTTVDAVNAALGLKDGGDRVEF